MDAIFRLARRVRMRRRRDRAGRTSHATAVVEALESRRLLTEMIVVVDANTPGYYNDDLGRVLDGTDPSIPERGSFQPQVFDSPPTLSAASGILGDWLVGADEPLALNSHWSSLQVIPESWTVDDETAIIYPLTVPEGNGWQLTGNFGVDNGISVWLDGEFQFGALAEGHTSPDEYPNIDLGDIQPGTHYLQILRTDHGGITGFDIEVIATQRFSSTTTSLPGSDGQWELAAAAGEIFLFDLAGQEDPVRVLDAPGARLRLGDSGGGHTLFIRDSQELRDGLGLIELNFSDEPNTVVITGTDDVSSDRVTYEIADDKVTTTFDDRFDGLIITHPPTVTLVDESGATTREITGVQDERLALMLRPDAARDRMLEVMPQDVGQTFGLSVAFPDESIEVTGTPLNDNIQIEPLPATFTGGVVFDGGDGNDVINALGVAHGVTAMGGFGADSLYGGAGPDYLDGGPGIDAFRGRASDDTIIADSRDDSVNGGNDNDVLQLAPGTRTFNLIDLTARGIVTNFEEIDLRDDTSTTLTLDASTVESHNNESDSLLVQVDSFDLVDIGTGWSEQDRSITGGVESVTRSHDAALLEVRQTLDGLTPYAVSVSHSHHARAAGDLNRDGFDDFVVRDSTPGRSGSRVVFGSRERVTIEALTGAAPGASFFIPAPSDGLPSHAHAAGDVNGDGFGDLLVRTPSSGADSVFVLFGRPRFDPSVDLTELDGSDGFRFVRGPQHGFLAAIASSAGDFNGDGFDDLFITAGNTDGPQGEVLIVFGQATFNATLTADELNGQNGFRITDDSGLIYTGRRTTRDVSGIGDVNGDGFDDVAIHDNIDLRIVTGRVTPPAASVALTDLSTTRVRHAGWLNAISPAGDVNNDGVDDVVFGTQIFNGTRGGAVVLYGNRDGFGADIDMTNLPADAGFFVEGTADRARMGAEVAGVGDSNGDGIDDILTGESWFVQTESRIGRAHLVFGQDAPDGTPQPGLNDSIVLAGQSHSDELGSWVYGLGDINGDGLHDYFAGSAVGGFNSLGDAFTPASDDPRLAYFVFGGEVGTTPAGVQIGSIDADELTATNGAAAFDGLVGGDGNDVLIGDGGPDALLGGRGDDRLEIGDATFRQIDGGSGYDTLAVTALDAFDMTAISDTRLDDIEAIDLRGGAGTTLTLDLRRVLRLSSTSNHLTIRRSPDDSVSLGEGWTSTGTRIRNDVVFERLVNGAATVDLELDSGPIALPEPGAYTLTFRDAPPPALDFRPVLVLTNDATGTETTLAYGGDVLSIFGTPGDDTLTIDFNLQFPDNITDFVFLDGGGNDRVVLSGSTGNRVELLKPGITHRLDGDQLITGGGWTVTQSRHVELIDTRVATQRGIETTDDSLRATIRPDSQRDRHIEFVPDDSTLLAGLSFAEPSGFAGRTDDEDGRTVTFLPLSAIHVTGTSGDDVLRVEPLPATMATGVEFYGHDGNDFFDALGVTQPVTVFGGAGADTLHGGAGADRLSGGPGSDALRGRNGDDTLGGDDGADRLDGGNDNDVQFEILSATFINVRGDGITGAGADRLDSMEGVLGVQSGNRDSFIGVNGYNQPLLLVGGSGNDTIRGGMADDTLIGSGGNDDLLGNGGNDLVSGGSGDDTMQVEEGNDTVDAGSGLNDRLSVSTIENVTVTATQLTESGGRNRNVEIGGEFERLTLNGTSGPNRIDASAYPNSVVISGGAGNDTLLGGTTRDTIRGNSGADQIFGGAGNDNINGGNGPDLLDGGAGNDLLRGGGQRDRFVSRLGDSDLIISQPRDFAPIVTVSGDAVLTDANVMVRGRLAEIHGDDGPNRIDASAVTIPDLRIRGMGGDDTLFGGTQGNELLGGDGDDELHGGAGNDWLDGEAGNDDLSAHAGNDTLTGGFGDDTLTGGAGNDVRAARPAAGQRVDLNLTVRADGSIDQLGTDTLSDEVPLTRIIGTDGVNRINAERFAAPLWIQGGGGNDTIAAGPGPDTIDGGSGRDFLHGFTGNDVINGGDGRDTLQGKGGDDVLRGGGDNDLLLGATGDDLLDGGDGNDRLKGHDGNDTLGGAGGNDLLEGGPGTDFRLEYVRSHVTITDAGIAGIGTDELRGELTLLAVAVDPRVRRGLRLKARDFTGPITLIGGAGNDTLSGGPAADVLLGGAGNDHLIGRGGDDMLFGEAGNDRADGGNGSDGISGGDGDDSLYGQNGTDTLAGGAGQNVLQGDMIDEAFGTSFRLLLDTAR